MRELLLPPTTQEVKAVWGKKRTIVHRIGCVCVWLGLGYYPAGYELPWPYRIKESDGNQTFDKSGPEAKGTKTSKQADPVVLPTQQDLAWMG